MSTERAERALQKALDVVKEEGLVVFGMEDTLYLAAQEDFEDALINDNGRGFAQVLRNRLRGHVHHEAYVDSGGW